MSHVDSLVNNIMLQLFVILYLKSQQYVVIISNYCDFILIPLQFEQDIHKVQSAHETLVESTKKREQLETMVRGKLEAEVKKLHDQTKLLQGM